MNDKIARLGIERSKDLMYFIKGGDVWAVPRKQPGKPKGKPKKIAEVGLDLDYSQFLYFLDGDGDVARKARHVGGGRKAKTRTKPSRAAAAPSSGKGKKKSEAQIAREVDACLARAKG
jgi:hypothetical protein